MKLKTALIPVAALAVAMIMTLPAFAAKGDRKKDRAKDAGPTFATLDTNKDGSISKDEYVTGMKDKLDKEAALKRFAELDKDKDDKLSNDELGTTDVKKKRIKKKKDTTN